MKKIVLLFALICSISLYAQRDAKTYLIQLGNGNSATWTKTLGANDSIVDLTVAGQNLTAWLAARTSWAAGDQIWIAAGTYSVTSYYNIGSSPSASTSYPSAIYGGFAGNESSIADRSKGADAWDYTHETIINGSGSDKGIFGAGSDRIMTIDGITFTGCVNTAGQAVYQRPSTSVQNCKFTSNACVALRYYITAASKTATVSNCYFYNNSNAVSGGAEGGCIMVNNGSSGGTYTVSNCVFDSNSSTASGSGASAGIKAQGAGNTYISNCIFKNNNATVGNSSAVSLTTSTTNLTNSLIYGTSSIDNKTALYITGGNVTNCTVVNNLGGAIYMNTTSNVINLTNSVFWGTDNKSGQVSAGTGCTGTITNCAYNSLSANFSGTVNNTVDLTTTTTGLFGDPDNNNWALASNSVLIDMGTSTGAPSVDLIGTTRPQGSGYDIGAYEYTTNTSTRNIYANKSIVNRVGNRLITLTDGLVKVYDISGKLCLNKHVRQGEEINLKSGIYLVELTTSSSDKSIQKVIL